MITSVNENKANTLNKWLIAGIGLLILIAAMTWFFGRNQGGLQEGSVLITAGGNKLGSFTVADLEKMPAVKKKMVVTPNCDGACANTGNAAPTKHLYTGVPLSEVFNRIDPAIMQKYSRVITRGIDYYSQVLEMSEVRQADNLYVVYSDNGQPLKAKTGGDGSLCLVVGSDESGQRFTNWLVSLELQ